MSDPFWRDVDAALPRTRRGEPGWARLRGRVLALARGEEVQARRWPAALAAGLALGAIVLTLGRPPAAPAGLRGVPSEDLEFLEHAPLLESLDELLDAPELDRA